MPLISSFFGILIKMYFRDDDKHHTPHFHAKFGEFEASIDFEGNILAGEFPPNKLKLVAAWAEIHKEELIALWDVMQTSDEYFKIKGLD
ncbi:MAG: DUF4160 domain-containing protein [Treponemataceae bacterium]|jgi:hypothetical protein|nr:DUF4160 domain-containing protein [Treponemataceae bacterium]